MSTYGRQPPHDSRGQALVEFALIVPALVLLLLGIMEFGRAVYASNALANAAREGARYGIINPQDSSGIQAHAIETAVGLRLSPGSVTVSFPDGQPASGNRIRVIVSYAFQADALFVSPDFTLTGSATMTIL
jgi:Flp pilus assembly protein TadG